MSKRFKETDSSIHVQLILAEEQYLESFGWEMVDWNNFQSTWSRPDLQFNHSRQQALLITKAEDSKFGLY